MYTAKNINELIKEILAIVPKDAVAKYGDIYVASANLYYVYAGTLEPKKCIDNKVDAIEFLKRALETKSDIITETFTLYNYNTPLMIFSYSVDRNTVESFKVKSVLTLDNGKFPLALRLDKTNIKRWIDSRVIQSNRKHILNIYESLFGVGYIPTKFELLKVSRGMSVNDTFWICEEGRTFNYEDINLYDNQFSDALGIITFFGGTKSLMGTVSSTPETTTGGALPKAWKREDNSVYLYKRGIFTEDSEVIAYQLSKLIGIESIQYEKVEWNEIACSKCKLFTSKQVGLLTGAMYNDYIGSIFDGKCILPYNMKLKLLDMLVFDYIIVNIDRHLNNFGFLINNETGEILDVAPIYDNGYSMLANIQSNKEIRNNIKLAKYKKELSEVPIFKSLETALTLRLHTPERFRYLKWIEILEAKLPTLRFETDLEYDREELIRELLLQRCANLKLIIQEAVEYHEQHK